MPDNHLLDLLFRRHGKKLLAFAERQTAGNGAEDLVQEAYLRLLRHPDPASIANPRAYLYKVIGNLGIDLNKLDRLNYTEVAKSLGISTKSAQRYILKAWQHCLNRLGDNPFDDHLSN